jgi:hypothetical protein
MKLLIILIVIDVKSIVLQSDCVGENNAEGIFVNLTEIE